MFNKVLIANRGAIAVRISRTLRRMGIQSVAVYSEADRFSGHRRAADEAWSLGAGPSADTYLNVGKLLHIMEAAEVDAVHPGYGFLSENPEFVAACEARGIAFIGPTPEQMQAFGLKHRARELAEQAGVPLLKGSDLLESEEDAVRAAESLGYPVMLKSTAGGGGIGMQVCRDTQTLRQAYQSVKRLGASHFANDGVFLERFIERARHLEVQILGNGQGQAVAIGERDCSAQRRNQKVLEECPAPCLSDTVRNALHETAVRLMTSVAYRNAGTVEFIYDDDSEQFWFLEVNTRLQVEHGVTEQVYGVDLVDWMLRIAASQADQAGQAIDLEPLQSLQPQGWSVQARLYAEDPNRNFQPSAGRLTSVQLPESSDSGLRIDHWIEPGLEVSGLYDPLLAKYITWGEDREAARRRLAQALAASVFEGIETNRRYLGAVLESAAFREGRMVTRSLNDFQAPVASLDVLSGGTLTTVQDYPGRVGYWSVGVPPSGPFDFRSFCQGNHLLGNPETAAGLEMTLQGATLRFNTSRHFVLTGAPIRAELDGVAVPMNTVCRAEAGQTLSMGKIEEGMRTCFLIEGGLDTQPYLGSRSTFTLGQFGGHAGRGLQAGDVLHLCAPLVNTPQAGRALDAALAYAAPANRHWTISVIYGPHGAPDFFTPDDIKRFFAADWEVHYNSSRTGVRLIGPKPDWARTDGGEAGMHPSNIHDNAYALGTIDFTGDMPVILGPDGPSLGGFVCPATVIEAECWKLGQLRPGDRIRFQPVTQAQARERAQPDPQSLPLVEDLLRQGAVLSRLEATEDRPAVVYRPAGDRYLLVEYGPLELDLRLRFRVHVLMEALNKAGLQGLEEMTPGIRSLQVRYDPDKISQQALLGHLQQAEAELAAIDDLTVPSRIIHLPLSWDDPQCRLAVEKYQQSVRADAPWCPDNIEFIRRINGLKSIDEVKKVLFEARYVVMGLGDVYLGAPVATPMDPRHRLVTTKYNPARTWTAENSVGIGGSYLCVYGMEGPGGYQFVGRTLQMWNRYHQTREFTQPWLLRFFDQICFYEVSADELLDIRENFPRGDYPLRIEETEFSLREYEAFLSRNQTAIQDFTQKRDAAFQAELQRWIESGQINFESAAAESSGEDLPQAYPDGVTVVEASVTGSVWKTLVNAGDEVEAGQTLAILESMKMELPLTSPASGIVTDILKPEGAAIRAGQPMILIEEASA